MTRPATQPGSGASAVIRVVLDGRAYRRATPSYLPSGAPPLLGRAREFRLLDAALLEAPAPGDPPLNVLLIGKPGQGKTALVEEYARRLGWTLYTIQGTDGMTAEEMAVTPRPVEESLERIEYVLSQLAMAMSQPRSLLLIDEISRLRPRTLAVLASVADHRRTLESPLAGFVIRAHPDFRLIATANSGDPTAQALPQFMDERLAVRIEVPPLPREVLDEIVRSRCAARQRNASRFLELFWTGWGAPGRALPSPRQIIQVCLLAHSLMTAEGRTELGAADVEEAVRAVAR